MRTLLFALISILATSCASVKVQTAQAPNIDFNKYTTFCWIQGCEIKYQGPDYGYSPERMQLLQETIKRELESKGLINDENNPDLLVGFHFILEEKESILANKQHVMDPYDRPISYWDGYEDYYHRKVYRYLQGSLIIDLIDSETSSVFWQSTTQRYIELHEQFDEKRMIKGVKKALKDYPSKMAKKESKSN